MEDRQHWPPLEVQYLQAVAGGYSIERLRNAINRGSHLINKIGPLHMDCRRIQEIKMGEMSQTREKWGEMPHFSSAIADPLQDALRLGVIPR